MSSLLKTSESGSNCHNAESLPTMAHSAGDAISREYHNFLIDIEDLIKQTTSLTGDDLALAKSKLMHRVAAAKESVTEMSADVSYRARKTAVATNNYVHEEPWKVIGAGAAVGFLLGVVIARR